MTDEQKRAAILARLAAGDDDAEYLRERVLPQLDRAIAMRRPPRRRWPAMLVGLVVRAVMVIRRG